MTFSQWKKGLGVLVRLLFLGLIINVVAWPLRFLTGGCEGYALWGIIIAYYVVVLPFVLPAALKWSGLQAALTGAFDRRGGANEAVERKNEELRRESGSARG